MFNTNSHTKKHILTYVLRNNYTWTTDDISIYAQTHRLSGRRHAITESEALQDPNFCSLRKKYSHKYDCYRDSDGKIIYKPIIHVCKSCTHVFPCGQLRKIDIIDHVHNYICITALKQIDILMQFLFVVFSVFLCFFFSSFFLQNYIIMRFFFTFDVQFPHSVGQGFCPEYRVCPALFQ